MIYVVIILLAALAAANKHDVPVYPQTQCACKGETP